MIQGLAALAPTIGALDNLTDKLSSPAGGAQQVSGGNFAEVLGNAVNRTAETLREAERLSVDALQGRAEMREVVEQVMSAEQSMQAAITIRDKIVAAYLEVSRMAI